MSTSATATTTLGTEPIGKLLRKNAIPSIIAMTAASIYNMVDSIFIGQGVGALAISGLAITFPLMNLAAAFGSLVGVGASTLISVKLGQRDYGTAQKVLGNVVVLNLVIGILFAGVSLLFLDPILYFFGASDQTIGYARDYMQVILLGNVVTHLYLGLNAALRAMGHPRRSMFATILTVVLNTLLDMLFIFGFGWGIQGAAIATVLAQLIALIWQLRIFSNKRELLHFHKGIFKLERKIVVDSLSIGIAPFMMNMAGCFVVIVLNNGLRTHGGDLAIGAYGIVNRIAFLFVMVVMGITQGMQPIVGYNYGARKIPRLLEVLKLSLFWGTVVVAVGTVLSEVFPTFLAKIFTTDQELIELSVYGMRIAFLVFPTIAIQVITGAFFTSIGLVRKSIFLSLTRQVIFLIPFLLILPHFYGLKGVWISLPIADLLSAIIAAILLVKQVRKFKAMEERGESIQITL